MPLSVFTRPCERHYLQNATLLCALTPTLLRNFHPHAALPFEGEGFGVSSIRPEQFGPELTAEGLMAEGSRTVGKW
jgi:hypothetical protein